MSYTHREKKIGDLIRSSDWNDMSESVEALFQQKADRGGNAADALVGSNLTANGKLSVSGLSSFANVEIRPPSNLSFGNNTRQMINLWSTSYGIGVQSATAYFRTNRNFAWYRGGSHHDSAFNSGSGGDRLMSIDGEGNLTIKGLFKGSSLSVSGLATFGDIRVNAPNSISFLNRTRQMLNLWSNQYGFGVQTHTLYSRSYENFAWFKGGTHHDGELNGGAGGDRLMSLDGSGNLTIKGLLKGSSLSVSGLATFGDIRVNAPNSISFVNRTRQMLNLWSNQYGFGVQTHTLYSRSYENFAWFKGGTHHDGELNGGSGGDRLMSLDGAGNLTTKGVLKGSSLAANGLTVQGQGTFVSLSVSGKASVGNIQVATAGEISFSNATRQMVNLYDKRYGIGVQSSTAYFRTHKNFGWYKGGSHNDGEISPGGGERLMSLDGSGNLYTRGVLNGAASVYQHAQYSLKGGGNVSWDGSKLTWDKRFIAIGHGDNAFTTSGHINIQPVSGGVTLTSWQSLYAEHTIMGSADKVRLVKKSYTENFIPPSNWIFIAGQNADDTTVKLGNGVTLSKRQKSSRSSPIPRGVIVMWSGTTSDYPEGWAECNGNNGTPNLRSRFIVAAGDGDGKSKTLSNYNRGARGGEEKHRLTKAEMPKHNHAFFFGKGNDFNWNTVNPSTNKLVGTDDLKYHAYRREGGPESFEGSNTAHENRPPYYALVFIMKL